MKVYKNTTLTSNVLREIADVMDSLEKLYGTAYHESSVIAHFPDNVKVEGVWSGDLGKVTFTSDEEWVFYPAASIFKDAKGE